MQESEDDVYNNFSESGIVLDDKPKKDEGCAC